MTIEQFLATLALAAIGGALAIIAAAWAVGFWRALKEDLPPPDDPVDPVGRGLVPRHEPASAEHVHHWQIETREQTAGRSFAIYRCPDCRQLEVRETP